MLLAGDLLYKSKGSGNHRYEQQFLVKKKRKHDYRKNKLASPLLGFSLSKKSC